MDANLVDLTTKRYSKKGGKKEGILRRMYRGRTNHVSHDFSDHSLTKVRNQGLTTKAMKKILIGDSDFDTFAEALETERTQKMVSDQEIRIHKYVKEIKKDTLEEYRKYYYGKDGKLNKRNDSPKSLPRKVRFGNPKDEFQEMPLEDYLFAGIKNDNSLGKNNEIKLPDNKEIYQQTDFLDSLRKLEEENTLRSLTSSKLTTEDLKKRREVKVILLTLHNVERITKRINFVNKNHKGTFKYENSINIPLPRRIEKKNKIKIDKQLSEFLVETSERLRQNKHLKHLYKFDGTPIFALTEVQPGSSVFVSHSPYFWKIIRESNKYLSNVPYRRNTNLNSPSSPKLSHTTESVRNLRRRNHYSNSFSDKVHKIGVKEIANDTICEPSLIYTRDSCARVLDQSMRAVNGLDEDNKIQQIKFSKYVGSLNQKPCEGTLNRDYKSHNVSINSSIDPERYIENSLDKGRRNKLNKEFSLFKPKAYKLNKTIQNHEQIRQIKKRKINIYFNNFAQHNMKPPILTENVDAGKSFVGKLEPINKTTDNSSVSIAQSSEQVVNLQESLY
ncbi:unnamed protein product [Moneuplotes crassus]|uniref:Uncharacterized protein n=1 Tax=Euplotes crassus TaxID=5936 RepID=A0AAD1U7R0_EUPCR|nr:unnamed protein product [Moneuplotes crassus]